MGLKDFIPAVAGLDLDGPVSDSLGPSGSLVDATLVPGPDGKTMAIDLSSGQPLQINAQGKFESLTARLSPDNPSKAVRYKPVDQKPVIINSGTRQTVVQAQPPPPSPVLLAEGREAWDELVRYEAAGPFEPGEAREVFALDFARNPTFRKKQRDRRAAMAAGKAANPAPVPTPREGPRPADVNRRRRKVDI